MERLSDKAKRVVCNLNDLHSDSIKVRDEAEDLCQRAYKLEGKTSDDIHNLLHISNPNISDMLEYDRKHRIEMEKMAKELQELERQRRKNHIKSKTKRKTCSCKKK